MQRTILVISEFLVYVFVFLEFKHTTLHRVQVFHQPNSNVQPLTVHHLMQSGTKTWLLVVHIHAVPCLHAGLNDCGPLVVLLPSCDRITTL